MTLRDRVTFPPLAATARLGRVVSGWSPSLRGAPRWRATSPRPATNHSAQLTSGRDAVAATPSEPGSSATCFRTKLAPNEARDASTAVRALMLTSQAAHA